MRQRTPTCGSLASLVLGSALAIASAGAVYAQVGAADDVVRFGRPNAVRFTATRLLGSAWPAASLEYERALSSRFSVLTRLGQQINPYRNAPRPVGTGGWQPDVGLAIRFAPTPGEQPGWTAYLQAGVEYQAYAYAAPAYVAVAGRPYSRVGRTTVTDARQSVVLGPGFTYLSRVGLSFDVRTLLSLGRVRASADPQVLWRRAGSLFGNNVTGEEWGPQVFGHVRCALGYAF